VADWLAEYDPDSLEVIVKSGHGSFGGSVASFGGSGDWVLIAPKETLPKTP